MANRSRMMRMGWRKRVLPGVAGLVVLVVTAFIHFYNPDVLSRQGNQLFDQYQRWEPRVYEDVGVRVIDIDEESIHRIGQWPWPRSQVAQMAERLFNLTTPLEYEGETYVIPAVGAAAFDIVFSEPDRTSPENLRETLEAGGASLEVLAELDFYVPHDFVLGRTFKKFSDQGLAIITSHFFERTVGDDTGPKRRVGFASSGTIPVQTLPRYLSVTQSLPAIVRGSYDSGFISGDPDIDGVYRKADMIAYLDRGQDDELLLSDDLYPSLSLALYRFYLEAIGQPAGAYRIETSTGSGNNFLSSSSQVSGIRFGENFVPTTFEGKLLLHYTDGYQNRIVPAWKLLDPDITDEELRAALVPQDGERAGQPALVFVGTSAQGLRDLRSTPVDQAMPGVLIHAQATEQMILGHFLTQPEWAPGVRLLSIILGGLVLVLIIPIAGPLRSGVLAVLIISGMIFASWQLYLSQQTLFDPVYPAAALLLVYLITSTSSFVLTEAEKSHINGAFSRYLSPDMVARIADDPGSLELGGENREMTILFSDIRGFSKISEGMTSAELTSFLNRYLTPMTQILMGHKATVDKYIGDAIMAFWNAPLDDPDQYRNAALSALEMQARLAELNAARNNPQAPDSEKLPVETHVGIGLYSGDCSVGNMGSDQRFDYSVLGDVVNTSSRLEGMTKQYGVGILVGDATAQHLEGFALVELDRAKAVGKDSWLTIYALVGDGEVANDPAFNQLLGLQEDFLAAYRRQDFDEALTLLGELSRLGAGFGLGKHYTIMQERIEAYKVDPPPEDWEGVYVLRQK